MMDINKNKIKKRIMFNKDEDYYFLTYNILLLLNQLDCTSKEKSFWDYKKLIYLIEIITDNKKLNIALKETSLNEEDYDVLQTLYISSVLKNKLLRSILFALENNGCIHLERNSKRNSIDVWLEKENISSTFLNLELFELEIKNIKEIKDKYSRIRTMKTGTFLSRIFSERGIIVWDV
jgi:hypothetical protein